MNYADIHTYGDVMGTAKPKRKTKGFVLPSPTLIMAGVIVALSLSNILFINLWQGARDDLVTFRTQVEEQQKQLKADADAARADSERISGDVSRSWADALAWHRSHPAAVRVQSNCDPAGLRPLPSATGEPTGLQAGSGESWITTTQCEHLANDAILDREWIEQVKDWTKRQHEVKR